MAPAKTTKAKKAKPAVIEVEDVEDAPAPAAPTGPKAGTAEWLQQRRAKLRARPRAPLSDAERARQRAKWQEHKDKYNEQRRLRTRQAREALGELAPKVGRPKGPPVNTEPPGPIEADDMAEMLSGASSNVPISVIQVPEQPPWLRDFLDDEVPVPPTMVELPAFHTNEWSTLAPKTQMQYIRNAVKALRAGGVNIGKTKDPYEIGKALLDEMPNLFELLAAVTNPDRKGARGTAMGVNSLNGEAAALLSISGTLIRRMVSQKETSGRHWVYMVQANVLFQRFNNHFKGKAREKHQQQDVSPQSQGKVVEWGEWVTKAKTFIKKNTGPKATFEQWRSAILVAVYSLIPPVRLAWRDVKVSTDKPAKGSKDNTLYVTSKSFTSYWGHFKNAKSFAKQLPVEHPIKVRELQGLLRKYLKMLKGPYLFPKANVEDSQPMTEQAFGKYLADTTQAITGKRFSATPLRVSFITGWHNKHSKNGTNLKKVKEVMFYLLQTNIAVNEAYNKVNAEDVYTKALKELEAEEE